MQKYNSLGAQIADTQKRDEYQANLAEFKKQIKSADNPNYKTVVWYDAPYAGTRLILNASLYRTDSQSELSRKCLYVADLYPGTMLKQGLENMVKNVIQDNGLADSLKELERKQQEQDAVSLD